MRVDLARVLPLGVLLLAGCEKPFTPDPPLRVERVSPGPGEQLFLNQEIRVEFNTEIDPISVTHATVKVLDERGNAVQGRRNRGARWVSFEPFPPLRPDLSDGSFQANRVYRLVVAGFPLNNSIRSVSGRVLQDGLSQELRTVPMAPRGYPSPLLPVGLGIEPFRLRLEGDLSRQVAAGSGRLRVQFTLPVLPTSLSPEGFEVRILRVTNVTETLTPIDARLLSLPEPIDPYPGSTVEIWLGDLDLAPGDLVAVRLTGGDRALRDYRGRELETDVGGTPPAWLVVEGDRLPLAEWPDDDEPFEPLERGLPSFGWLDPLDLPQSVVLPRLSVEAGGGGLGKFRPLRDTILRPGVSFDRGDGVFVQSPGPEFEFVSVEIPAGVTVGVESEESVRILSCGSILIAGTLDLDTPTRTTAYHPGQEVALNALLRDSGFSLLAGGEIAVTGSVRHRGADGSALSMVAGAGCDLRGPIPPRTVLADRIDLRGQFPPHTVVAVLGGLVTGAVENPFHVRTSLTQGLPAGMDLTVDGWSRWRAIPVSHGGPAHVVVDPQPLPDGVEILVQVAPADPLDPSVPDRRSQVLEQPRPLSSIEGGLDVPPGGFVRLLLRARVRGGQRLPVIRKVQILAN